MKPHWRPLRFIRNWVTAFVDPRLILGLVGFPRYLADWFRYNRLAGSERVVWQETYPCLTDWTIHTSFDAHYFYQACWMVRKLAEAGPTSHVDIGSSVMMIGAVSALVPTIFIDYRPIRAKVRGLTPMAGDLLALPFADGSIRSLSCLHVIEHIGLGRYGDALDPKGSFKAARELVRVLAPGGRLVFSTTVGQERLQFNAHRVFAPGTVISMFNGLELLDFAMVDDKGDFFNHANIEQASICKYACGMFEFIRHC